MEGKTEKKVYKSPDFQTEIMTPSTWACQFVCEDYTGTGSGSTLFTNPLFDITGCLP